jgi:hypothetical protein
MTEIKVQRINRRWTAMVSGKRRTYPEGAVVRDVIRDVLAPGVRVLVVPEVRR